MSLIESGRESGPSLPSSRSVRSQCPDCPGNLAVMRVVGGRAGCEYWTLRCTRCGGIHLDVIKARVLMTERRIDPVA